VNPGPPADERDREEIRAAIDASFDDRRDCAAKYAELLRTAGIERGMIGPREADRVWERHLLNSAALAPLIPPGTRVVDLGSGAGLPGIPLAIARPDLTVVLLEPMQRRVRFLADCLEALGLPNASIHHGRGEAGLSPPADVVVARAVASLVELVRLSYRLLVDNGTLLALKGRDAASELEQARATMRIEAEMLRVPAPGEPATVIRVTRPSRLPPPSTGRRKRGGV
jgi:16S rRNA (guanine527-N7)-methyltransferase